MKIRILTSCSGLDFSFKLGDVVDVRVELANDLIGGRLAEKIESEPKPKPKAGAKKDADS